MNFHDIVQELQQERDRLDKAIRQLESLDSTTQRTVTRKIVRRSQTANCGGKADEVGQGEGGQEEVTGAANRVLVVRSRRVDRGDLDSMLTDKTSTVWWRAALPRFAQRCSNILDKAFRT